MDNNKVNQMHHYRMYCFVERHLSPIDKGIQSAHSIVEYANKYLNTIEYVTWAYTDKTIILLNGGVVNDLRNICTEFTINEIKFASFHETDMDDMLTCISVLVDERVYDDKNYPNFEKWCEGNGLSSLNTDNHYAENYQKWKNFIGGDKNVILKSLINKHHLSR